MPVLDEEQVLDEVMAEVNSAWTATGALSEDLFIGFEGVHQRPPSGVTTGTKTRPESWCWNTILPVDGRQIAFGAKPNRRFGGVATFRCQIFGPATDGLLFVQRLGKIVQEALEDMRTTGGVIADEVRPNKVGLDKTRTWYRYDVMATLRYERVR
jgi:hypothetical protein